MIYLFYGTDKVKAREMAHKAIEAALGKHPGALSFGLNTENWAEDKLPELIGGQGLFYSGFVVFMDFLLDDAGMADVLIKKIKEIAESPNFFVFLEEKLNKKELEKFEKYAKKIEEFKKPEKKLSKKEALALKGEKIDFFEFANALGEKNKKLLWTLYQDTLNERVPSEEVHGIFFWQVKTMLSAIKSKDAAEAGLNPYVFNKSKAYAKNYHAHQNARPDDLVGQVRVGDGEKLKEMSLKLFNMYHEAHRGRLDFAVALERFILEL